MDYVAEVIQAGIPMGRQGTYEDTGELRVVPRLRPVDLHHRHHAAPRRRRLRVGRLVQLARARIREQPARLRLRARRMTLLARAQGLSRGHRARSGPVGVRRHAVAGRRRGAARVGPLRADGAQGARRRGGRSADRHRGVRGGVPGRRVDRLDAAGQRHHVGVRRRRTPAPPPSTRCSTATRIPVAAGQFSPRGTAVRDRRRATWSAGRYSFGSGSAHAPWIGGGALELRDGEFVPSASGMPVIRAYFVPRTRWSSSATGTSWASPAPGATTTRCPSRRSTKTSPSTS